MLRIISGSLEDLKAEMKQAQASIASEIKLRKIQYKRVKTGVLAEMIRIMDLEKRVFYSFSKVQPILVEGLIVDFRAIKAFEKKLKNAHYWVEKRESKLIILYDEKKSLGRVELNDLSKHYEGFKFIPEAVIV